MTPNHSTSTNVLDWSRESPCWRPTGGDIQPGDGKSVCRSMLVLLLDNAGQHNEDSHHGRWQPSRITGRRETRGCVGPAEETARWDVS